MNIVSCNRSKNNELYLIIDFTGLKNRLKNVVKKSFFKIFQLVKVVTNSLNQLTNNNALIALIMSAGLGFGFGITIFSQPDFSSAQSFFTSSSEQVKTNSIRVLQAAHFEIEIIDEEKNQIIQNNQTLVIPSFSGSFDNPQQAFYLKGTVQFGNYLRQLTLGDELVVKQDNNLIKKFHIIEIKSLNKEKITQLLPQNQDTLILYVPLDILSDQFYCLVARS
ncbi:MAG: hypothetical protein U9O78_01505 [Patescibacteria group bacterium]|nr:hypothetical protein [Patescibacteria group bacterium]